MATLVTSWQTTWPGNVVWENISTTSGSLSVQAGDVIVVWTVAGNAQYLQGANVSDSQSNSYTERQSYTGSSSSNFPFATLHTAVAGSTGTLTVTSTISQSGGLNIGRCGIYVSVWRDVDTVGASAQAYNGNWTPSVGLTTTQANSVVIGFDNDWNASSNNDDWSTSPGTPTEVVSFGDNSTYGLHVAYYSDAGSAGAKTISMVNPTGQSAVIFALELTATSEPAVDQSDFQFFDDDGALPGYSYGTTPVIEAADVTGSGNNTASNPSVTYPAYSTGDLLIQVVAVDQNRTITLPATGPNGETINTICNTVGGGTAGPALACIYWVATAGQSSGNTAWSLDTTDSWDAQTIRVPSGEFDPAKPIDVISSVGTSASDNATADMPAFTADRASGRIVVVGGVDADPMDATFSPTGWTDLYDNDRGAICSFSATRDSATSAAESVSSAAFGINTGDTYAIVGFVVNAPRSQTGATATAAVNTNPELDVDTTYRWHVRVENTGAATSQATWKVQYKHTQGTNTWTDVSSSSSVVRATLSSQFANGDDVTEFIGGDGTYVTNNNAALESSGSATLAAALGASAAFELHLAFQVRSADVDDADTIQLRIVESDGTALDSYTNTPTITANEEAAFTTGTGAASGTGAAAAVGISTADSDGVAAGTGAAAATGASTADSDGASAGTGAATGVGNAIFEGVGAASGTGTAAAAGLGVNVADGAAAASGAATAVGASTADGVGTATATSDASAVGVSTAAADGASNGVGTAAAVGASLAQAVGTAEATGAAAGVAVAATAGVGAADATGAATAVGAATAASVGEAAGTGTATAIGSAVAAAVGASSGTGAATATGAATLNAVGTAAGTGAASAAGSTLQDGDGDGQADGVGEALAVGASTAASDGVAAGAGAASATGASTAAADGDAAATGTATATGAAVAATDGTSAGAGSASAVGAAVFAAVGDASAAGAAAAIGSSIAAAVGEASATGAADGVGEVAGVDASDGEAAGTGTASAVGSSVAAAVGTAAGTGAAAAIAYVEATEEEQRPGGSVKQDANLPWSEQISFSATAVGRGEMAANMTLVDEAPQAEEPAPVPAPQPQPDAITVQSIAPVAPSVPAAPQIHVGDDDAIVMSFITAFLSRQTNAQVTHGHVS